MLANRSHKRRARRGQPAALKRYWASRRGVSANPRRHHKKRRVSVAHVVRYRRNPRSIRTLFSGSNFTTYGVVALGMVAPGALTDRILPMLGIQLTGWLRRGVQFLLPVSLQFFAPNVLGKYKGPVLSGMYAVSLLGVVNDLAGFPGMVGGYTTFPRTGPAGTLRGYVDNRRIPGAVVA